MDGTNCSETAASPTCNEDSNNINIVNEFVTPQREIKTLMSLGKWSQSEAYKDLLGFIMSVNEVVKGKSLNEPCNATDAVKGVEHLLNTLETWVDKIPPCEQPQRFGNKAFRDWHAKLVEISETIIVPLLSDNTRNAVVELKAYLHDSFGNSTRIDYGTGHETCFLFFLCCLYKLKVLVESDNLAVVNIVFKKYLKVTRKLQTTYRMEPAGSQGVWGLDDFQFVPFIWGSSQLVGHLTLQPEHFVDPKKIEMHGDEFLFFDSIRYINTVKTGPFAEHSNVLWGISSVPNWGKVNSGLLKMYKVEVLSKFPVVQHFVFGNIISMKQAK